MRSIFVICMTIWPMLIGEGEAQCSSEYSHGTLPNTIYTAQSPSYPGIYTANAYCRWSITGSTSSKRILFSIPSYNLELSYDFLTVYDGSSQGYSNVFYSRYASTPNYAITSQQNAYVTFTSDYSVQYGGFSIDYVEVDSWSQLCTGTLTPTSTKQHVWYTQFSDCTYNFNVGSGSVTEITVLNYVGTGTEITFADTDGSSSQTINTAGTSVYVSSTANSKVRIVGNVKSFMMTYKEVASGVTNNIVTTASVVYGDNMCSYSYLTATSTAAYLTSPNYPSSYQTGIQCTVTITAISSDSSVMLVFDDFELFNGDSIEVYDGFSTDYNYLAGYNSWSPPGGSLNSTGTSLTLHFFSDNYGVLRGFQLHYSEITSSLPSCASTYPQYPASGTPQTITKGVYSNYEIEYWLIVKPSESDNLVLDLSSMSVEEATTCRYDSITFYDGACTTDSVIATVCGYSPVTFEDTTGRYVLVRFKSDGSVTRNGFTLNYYTGTYVSADASTSNDDDDEDSNTIYYSIAVACVFSMVFFISVIAVVVYYRQTKRRRTAIANGTAPPTKPKVKLITTHQLLSDVTKKVENDGRNQRKLKLQRKQSKMNNINHPEPAPPGPGVTIINRTGQPVHPTPSAPPLPFGQQVHPGPPPGPISHPAYPPVPYNVGALNTGPYINPAFPPGYDPNTYGKPLYIPPGKIPPHVEYFSPTEARALGLHQ